MSTSSAAPAAVKLLSSLFAPTEKTSHFSASSSTLGASVLPVLHHELESRCCVNLLVKASAFEMLVDILSFQFRELSVLFLCPFFVRLFSSLTDFSSLRHVFSLCS